MDSQNIGFVSMTAFADKVSTARDLEGTQKSFKWNQTGGTTAAGRTGRV